MHIVNVRRKGTIHVGVGYQRKPRTGMLYDYTACAYTTYVRYVER